MKNFRNVVLFLLLLLSFSRCEKDRINEEPVLQDSSFTVEQAEAWFGADWQGAVSLKSGHTENARIGIKPDWCNGFTSQNDEVEVVEVGLLAQGKFDMADEASHNDWVKTKNPKMIRSLTRMVFLKYKKDGRIDQFLMTIVGDKEYHENHASRLSTNYYLSKEKHFSGYIYYHDLIGKFVNGWIYEKGKLVGVTSLVEGKGLPTQLKMATTCISTIIYTTYVQCTDWYADSNYNGSYDEGIDQYTNTNCGDPYTLMSSFTECPVYFTGSGGFATSYITNVGGTNGGYDPSQAPAPTEKKYEKILDHNYLNLSQTNLLEEALNTMINEHCLTQRLFNSLVNNGVSLNFNISSSSSSPASYYPTSKTVYFNANSSITSENLKEELFHALQDSYYSGGTAQYASTGKVNIEFETKLFKDVMQYACCDAFNIGNAPESVKQGYYYWVQGLEGDPGRISNTDYQYWLGLFNQYTPAYSSQISLNLNSPNLLKSLMLNCLN